MTTPPITPPSKSGFTSPPRKHRPIHLILDFDGTITREDTTTILAEAACDKITRNPAEKWKHCNLWETCCQKYFSEVENHPNIKALKENRTTINEEIRYQRSLRVIEEASVARVGQSGIFKGVAAWVWRETGWRECQNSRVKIAGGFRALVERVQIQGGRWGIVSVNWSQDFLRGVLGFALGGDTNAESVPVLSNRVIGETGFVVGPKFGPGPRSSPAMKMQPVCASMTKVGAWSFRQLQVRT
jgi:thiamine phosphate phosphatase / amino-HMP aminohydrolase